MTEKYKDSPCGKRVCVKCNAAWDPCMCGDCTNCGAPGYSHPPPEDVKESFLKLLHKIACWLDK